MIVNKKQLSEIIGKSEEWLTQMQKDPTFPVLNKRKGRTGSDYETSEVISWIEKKSVSNLIGNQDAIDIEEAKRRKMAAEAGLAELELMKEQGSVIEIQKVADEFGEQLTNFRAKMLSLPSKIAAQVFTAQNVQEIRSIIEDGIHEALNEIRQVGERDTSGESEEGDSESDLQTTETASKVNYF